MEATNDSRGDHEVGGRAIASLVLGILAITGVLPCVGSLLAIGLALGQRSDVARAGLLLGFVSLLLPLIGAGFVCCFGVPLSFWAGLL